MSVPVTTNCNTYIHFRRNSLQCFSSIPNYHRIQNTQMHTKMCKSLFCIETFVITFFVIITIIKFQIYIAIILNKCSEAFRYRDRYRKHKKCFCFILEFDFTTCRNVVICIHRITPYLIKLSSHT